MWWIIGGALLIGVTLGLLGSGGSILTVPVLVYLLGHDNKVAIAESLGIVGAIALVAAVRYAAVGAIDWRSVLYFGIPGMVGTYGGAWLAHFVPGAVQLILFAIVMLVAAWMMSRDGTVAASADGKLRPTAVPAGQHAAWKIGLEGLAVGVLTGLVGVGGGFLIVPALVVFGKLPMKLAVGTSLVIIALKSATGFAKYLGVLHEMHLDVDWQAIAWFCGIGSVGSLIGSYFAARLNQQVLKRGFAVFLIAMGIFVLTMEIPRAISASKTASAESFTP